MHRPCVQIMNVTRRTRLVIAVFVLAGGWRNVRLSAQVDREVETRALIATDPTVSDALPGILKQKTFDFLMSR